MRRTLLLQPYNLETFEMNHRRPAGFLFWFCICLAGSTWIPCAIAGSTLAPAEVSSILEVGRFRDLHSAKEVPIDVLKKCFPNGAPADPGKPWNPTDVVQDASLPFSRVIWLATDGTHWLFAWEHGGIEFSTGFMMVSKMEGTLPTIIWDAGVAKKPLNTFQEFKEYIRTNGQFADASSFRP
jgi:hypothetical protein